jgi:hypothetical protein
MCGLARLFREDPIIAKKIYQAFEVMKSIILGVDIVIRLRKDGSMLWI